LDVKCSFEPVVLAARTSVTLPNPQGYRARLILPLEIRARRAAQGAGFVSFELENTRPEFNSNYAVFYVVQTPAEFDVQASRVCSSRLVTVQFKFRRSYFPSYLLCLLGSAGFALALVMLRRNTGRVIPLRDIVLARWGFSVFTVSLIYLGYRHLYRISALVEPWAYAVPESSRAIIYLRSAGQSLLRWFYFQGKDYDYFFQWVADPLYFYMVCLNVFVLYFVVRPNPEEDKYWALMRRFYAMGPLRLLVPQTQTGDVLRQRALVRLALLSLSVKTFYLPLLCSWTINQVIHVGHLRQSLSMNFLTINAFLVEALILIDVSIFSLGYLTELPQFKNTIRSVEPTVLGWVVCLMCYPPFNGFAFKLFDHPLNETWSPAFGTAHAVVMGVITILWAIYVWATIALGLKSSNLTNRGIVASGPYRYVRHPAYVSKVSLWILSSFFIGDKNFYLIVALVVVYALRAWTEERHLSRDPDYAEYKKKVRWVIIPKII
ncbi:MAG TPA: methyltransferase, partial [Oligoflexia bacterium]|nr:methyltransferase [Oligoflexia bacterium]